MLPILATFVLAATSAASATPRAQFIAMGGSHACALTPAKSVKCWGDNSFGQLGSDAAAPRGMPVEVKGLDVAIDSVAAGDAHSCVITAQGAAKCWGRNNHGQLGDGTTTDRRSPVEVTGLGSGVVSLSAGGNHTCAVTSAGAAKCWGDNSDGELGNGTMNDAIAPLDVAGLSSGAVSIATSDRNTCALTTGGAVQCWGYDGIQETNCRQRGEICLPNFFGGTTCSPITVCDYVPRYRLHAETVAGMEAGFTTVAVGSRICGLNAQRIVFCTEAGSPAPAWPHPTPGAGALALATGADFDCLLDNGPWVYCHGYGMYGQLGDGGWSYSGPLVAVRGLPGDLVGIAAAEFSACAIASRGDAYCWGRNAAGQLGDGTTVNRNSAVSVFGLENAEWPGGLTGLWWNAAESGWGLGINHQGDIVFATLFTYDAGGKPMWLVMSNGSRQPGSAIFAGDLYRMSGSPFDATPFAAPLPQDAKPVGTMTIGVLAADSAFLTYTVDGVAVAKTIAKQVFGSRAAYCSSRTGDRRTSSNFQDLWWNPAEPGWGLGIAHQDDVLFATLFSYGADRKDLWLVMSNGKRQADGSYAGDLYQVTGPAFNAQPFTPITSASAIKVGTMRLSFANGETGTLAYSVNGAAVTKAIARQVFSSPLPACN